MTIPSYLHSEMHLENSLTKRNFKDGSWISKQEFAQERTISRSYCSGSTDRSNQLAEGPPQSTINYGKRFLWLWRIRIDDGSRNWNAATILFIWSTKLPSVEPWQDKRAKNSYTERKTEECFQRKTIGSCSTRDACGFLHTHATGDREDNVEWSGDTQEILT